MFGKPLTIAVFAFKTGKTVPHVALATLELMKLHVPLVRMSLMDAWCVLPQGMNAWLASLAMPCRQWTM